ncbi:MAG: hypothetical protein AB1391_03780, partial [Candidatus Micrarchaeota archaeon]
STSVFLFGVDTDLVVLLSTSVFLFGVDTDLFLLEKEKGMYFELATYSSLIFFSFLIGSSLENFTKKNYLRKEKD